MKGRTTMVRIAILGALSIALISPATVSRAESQGADVPRAKNPPNVILILTDDQGYGDLGCHGNTEIKTPALDRLQAESVRLTDFHVDPTCSPTRSALMTGRYSTRTGVWHTIAGRSLLRKEEVTLADLFSAAGYRTGIFGKWHLGDNAPLRPQDRGFDEVLVHGGGGVGQTPDVWGNDYFDDTYLHNGRPEKFTGYCTDVWFDGATRFIEAHRRQPFFAYIATNAPHGPYLVDEKYSRPYRDAGIPSPRAEFYGMITNIDENVARLRQKLEALGLAENTLLIFMTDNGTAAGVDNKGGFNVGMRGRKGSPYDGGHRVPCFFHWPAGRLTGGRDVDVLTAHIDLLPTLAEICGLAIPENMKLDGTSLVSRLKATGANSKTVDSPSALNERILFVHSQRVEDPIIWRQSSVMTSRWRFVDGKELYDITADPGQQSNVAAKHPDVVEQLTAAYDRWWESLTPRFGEYVRIELGSDAENPTTLTCHDWHAPQPQVPWAHAFVARDPQANGFWAVDVPQDGRYEFTLRRRPAGVEAPFPTAGTAKIRIDDVELESLYAAGAESVTLAVDLKKGPATLQTWLTEPGGNSRGAFFVTARRIHGSSE